MHKIGFPTNFYHRFRFNNVLHKRVPNPLQNNDLSY